MVVLRGKETAISDQFLDTHLKCLQLFWLFLKLEIKKYAEVLKMQKYWIIVAIIDLGGKVLLPSDVECITLFLTC